MASDERWLGAVWPFVRGQLPTAPARVIELGCGPLGGFIPMLAAAGYDAVGVDPGAPGGPWYRQVEFERYDLTRPADALVACTSLHHVADLGRGAGPDTVGAAAPRPAGDRGMGPGAVRRGNRALVLLPAAPGQRQGQLAAATVRTVARVGHGLGRLLPVFWAQAENLHSGQDILRALDARFGAGAVSYGPYFLPDLAGTSEDDEQAAINNGEIQAGRIQYSGHRRSE